LSAHEPQAGPLPFKARAFRGVGTCTFARAVAAGDLGAIAGLVDALEADLRAGAMERSLADLTSDPLLLEWARWEVERAGSRRVAAAALAAVFVRAAKLADWTGEQPGVGAVKEAA